MGHAADLEFARHLADVAAAVTLPLFGVRQELSRKADNTPVTAADGAAEQAIRQAVREQYPEDGVRGEEGGLHRGSSGRVWVVDPIDGTRMYAAGVPIWTTLIALRENDQVTVGVVDAPALQERATAIRGEGAWLAGRRLRVSDVDALSESFVLHAAVEEFVAEHRLPQLLAVLERAGASRGIADAWGYLLVARGAVDAVLESTPSYEWDWAAPGLVVEEAGGVVACREGGPPSDGCRLLVTNGRVEQSVRDAFSTSGRSSGAPAPGPR